MTWEPGKFYKTKGGLKARIYATDGKPSEPIHGAVLDKGCWDCSHWSGEGDSDWMEEWDLTESEWTDPRPKERWLAYGYQYKDGSVDSITFYPRPPSDKSNLVRVPHMDPGPDWEPGRGENE